MSSVQPQPIKLNSLQGEAVFNSFSANIGLYSTKSLPSKHYSVSVNTSFFIKTTWSPEDPAGYVDGLNLYGAYFDVNGVDPDGLGVPDSYGLESRTILSGIQNQKTYGAGSSWYNSHESMEGQTAHLLAGSIIGFAEGGGGLYNSIMHPWDTISGVASAVWNYQTTYEVITLLVEEYLYSEGYEARFLEGKFIGGLAFEIIGAKGFSALSKLEKIAAIRQIIRMKIGQGVGLMGDVLDGLPMIPVPKKGLFVMGLGVPIDSFTSRASYYLGKSLQSEGLFPNVGDAAHHIIARGSLNKFAIRSRKILKEFGVDINNSLNGVWLDNAKGSLHRRLHTGKYYENIYDRIKGITDRSDLIEELMDIRSQLLGGDFDF